MHSIELFAGVGGLALGLASAGFKHKLIVERDSSASSVILNNKARGVKHVADWNVYTGDVKEVDYSTVAKGIALVAGGPPCQPFSIGGKHLGPADDRNLWPEAVRAIRELNPKGFIFENVKGLLRSRFDIYVKYLMTYLSCPFINQAKDESWQDHSLRLYRYLKSSDYRPAFSIKVCAINAADFGAAQQRHRTLILGVRTDVTSEWEVPNATHSHEALIWSKYVDFSYWERHSKPVRKTPETAEEERLLRRLIDCYVKPATEPWRTVRDAFAELPSPKRCGGEVKNHRFRAGARVYKNHTGSVWDRPAKALKAGDHGVPGGENMLVHHNKKVRYFTLREMARLQGFPDDYWFEDAWKHPVKQLGNAVPVQVGHSFGKHMVALLGANTADV